MERLDRYTTPSSCFARQVSGVVEKDGVALKGVKLHGKWDRELHADLPDGSSRLLWRVNPPAADPSRCASSSAFHTS
jgi:hypothetical protein